MSYIMLRNAARRRRVTTAGFKQYVLMRFRQFIPKYILEFLF